MERKLIRKIVMCFVLAGTFLISIFSVLFFRHENNIRSQEVDMIFDQFEAVYEKSAERMWRRREMYETDYATRAKAIDLFLKYNPGRNDTDGLQELCRELDVRQIHLLNEKGEIVVSSLPKAVGGRLAESMESGGIRELINSRNPEEKRMILNGEAVFDNLASQDFIAVKSLAEQYAVIFVEIDGSVLKDLEEALDIENVMDSVPAISDQKFLVIDQDSRMIWGGTETAYTGKVLEPSAMEKLSGASQRKLTEFFGNRMFVKSRSFGNMLLVSIQLFGNGIYLAAMQALGCAVILCLIFLILMSIIRHYFKKYIFSEFEMIEKTIENVFAEQNDSLFYTEQDTEVRRLVEALNAFMNRNMEMRQEIQMSNIDVVTGLTNRKGFEEYITGIMTQGRKHGVMMMMDIDNFKLINDNMGHPEGDRALKIIANCLKTVFQENDRIVRLGGDEFVVFLEADIPKEQLKEMAEKVIRSLQEAVPDYYEKYKVSVSIGIAAFTREFNDLEELYRCADEALYEAKKNGKDQYVICVYEEAQTAE